MAFPDDLRPPVVAERGAIILAIFPSSDRELDIELQRSSTASTWRTVQFFGTRNVTGKLITYVDELPIDDITRTYRARHSSGLWWSAGPWTPEVSGTPFVYDGDIPLGTEAFRRVDTLYSADGVLKGVVSVRDGTDNAAPMRGYQSGQANGGKISTSSTSVWLDGAAVSFTPTFQSVPTVKLFPEASLIYYEPTAANWTKSAGFSANLAMSAELKAVNVTTTGFTPRARLVQRDGALTARTDYFSTGNSLSKGQATTATPANAPSYNDVYTAHFKVDMSLVSLGTPQTVTAVVAVDTNTTGSYIQRETNTYKATLNTTASTYSWTNESEQISVGSVDSTDKIRLRFASLNVSPGTTADVDVFVHGFHGGSDPVAGLTYYTQSSAVYAPMCPTTNDVVSWIAFNKAATT